MQRFRERWKERERGSAAGAIAFGALVALAFYVLIVLQPNLSWGVYAAF